LKRSRKWRADIRIIVIVIFLCFIYVLFQPMEPDRPGVTKKIMEVVNHRLVKYEREHGQYPSQDLGLRALGGKTPRDGWGNEFNYRSLNNNLSYELSSAGPDGIFDTVDDILTNPEESSRPNNNAANGP